jgi:hypothetical protein
MSLLHNMITTEILIKQTPENFEAAYVDGDLYHFELLSRDKVLDLYVLASDQAFAWTSINKRSLRIPGSTTALYEKAKNLIQEASNILQREINYTLRTQNGKMEAWAQGNGNEVFSWDTIKKESKTLFAEKTFHPSRD